MASSSDASPIPTKLVNLMHGFCASQAMFAGCELGVFDALHEAGHPQSAKKLSQQLSTDENATSRLLDVLVNIELLEKHTGETGESLYTNKKETQWLTKSTSPNIVRYVLFEHQWSYGLFGNLSHAIREGNSQWRRTFNQPSEEPFKFLFADEKEKIKFLEAMRGLTKAGAPFLVSAFDLSRFKNVCDLGGGTGDLAYAACKKYPDMKIKVLDLPPIIQCSSHFRPSIDECPNQHNVTFVEGDFFKPPLPTADLYVLSHILHDWNEEKIDVILSNVYNSLPSGGCVLLGVFLLNDDRSGPFYQITYDIYMLLHCGKGATDRSGLEYKQLLEKHGFKQVQYKVTGSNSADAVFAVKP